jgi:hypothetical protein
MSEYKQENQLAVAIGTEMTCLPDVYFPFQVIHVEISET